jgi:hypothetical protein
MSKYLENKFYDAEGKVIGTYKIICTETPIYDIDKIEEYLYRIQRLLQKVSTKVD